MRMPHFIYFDQVMRLPWDRLTQKMKLSHTKELPHNMRHPQKMRLPQKIWLLHMKELCHTRRLSHKIRKHHSNMRLSHSTRQHSNICNAFWFVSLFIFKTKHFHPSTVSTLWPVWPGISCLEPRGKDRPLIIRARWFSLFSKMNFSPPFNPDTLPKLETWHYCLGLE